MISLMELTDRVLDSCHFHPQDVSAARGSSDIPLRRRILQQLKSLVDSFPQGARQHVIAEMRFALFELTRQGPAPPFRGR
jgi:hypothetical protein